MKTHPMTLMLAGLVGLVAACDLATDQDASVTVTAGVSEYDFVCETWPPEPSVPLCFEERVPVAMGQSTALGASAAELLASVPSANDYNFVWSLPDEPGTPRDDLPRADVSTRHLEVHLDVQSTGVAHFVRSAPNPDHPDRPQDKGSCTDHVDVEVDMQLRSEDGRLAEHSTIDLRFDDLGFAYTRGHDRINAAELQGTLNDDVDLRSDSDCLIGYELVTYLIREPDGADRSYGVVHVEHRDPAHPLVWKGNPLARWGNRDDWCETYSADQCPVEQFPHPVP